MDGKRFSEEWTTMTMFRYHTMRINYLLLAATLLIACPLVADEPPDWQPEQVDLFADDNLFAWLVMFQDPVDRTPQQRAAMVAGQGFKKAAFEAFDNYLPILEEQVDAYHEQGIEVIAVYLVIKTSTPLQEKNVRNLLEVLQRRGWTPEIWAMFPRGSFENSPHQQRMQTMIAAFSELAQAVKEAGCRLGLYNYGSWFGLAEVQIEIIQGVKEKTGIAIGTVFNFHRGHQHMKNFPEVLGQMKPHLMAVNLNGMNLSDAGTTGGNAKILPVGQGDYELVMMNQLVQSGYHGPIGIIDHRGGVDAEQALKVNLEGLRKLRPAIASPH